MGVRSETLTRQYRTGEQKHMLTLERRVCPGCHTATGHRRLRGLEGRRRRRNDGGEGRKADDTDSGHLCRLQTYIFLVPLLSNSPLGTQNKSHRLSSTYCLPPRSLPIISVYILTILNKYFRASQPHRWCGGAASFLHEKLARDSRRLNKMYRIKSLKQKQ